ncbi:MAG TPA: ion transporter [Candidatus Thermoplasmatota archaeon]|nr:ion transporter [Candidatus Thermoplasmatota archaeon]
MPPTQVPVTTTEEPAAPRFTAVDGAMTLLALASVTLVIADIFARGTLVEWGIFTTIVWVDLAITVVFAAEFIFASRQDGLLRHIRNNWFDVIGMVPMIGFLYLEANISGMPFSAVMEGQVDAGAAAGAGALRLFRFIRIVRVVTALSRFLRATNMTLGEAVTSRIFGKYRRIIVAEVTTPILVAGITVSQEIIIRMKFLESAGKALDAKRPEIHAAVLEALQKNKVPQNVLTQPLVEKIVLEVEKTVVDTMVDTLTGPELNKLTQQMIVEVLEQFKQQLKSPEGKAMLKNLDLDNDGIPDGKQFPQAATAVGEAVERHKAKADA